MSMSGSGSVFELALVMSLFVGVESCCVFLLVGVIGLFGRPGIIILLGVRITLVIMPPALVARLGLG